jgi:hypothetical protein
MTEVIIQYKLRAESEVQKKVLLPEEYFDSLLEGENYIFDGIPKFNHAWNYTGYKPKALAWTEVYIRHLGEVFTKTRTEFYENGKHSFIQRVDRDGYEILIHSIKLSHEIEQIIRTMKKGATADWVVESIMIGVHADTNEERWFDLKREKIALEDLLG